MAKANPKPSGETEVPFEAVMIPLAEIDDSPAAGVREGLDEETVERYAAADQEGDSLPPVDAFHFRGDDRDVFLLADGRHRCQAWGRNRRTLVSANVRRCSSRAEAERLAWAHAAGANCRHGLQRRNGDVRAAIRAVIGRPEHEMASDREIARLVKCSRTTVASERESLSTQGKLSGGALAQSRYEPGASRRSGHVSDGKGGHIPKPVLASPEVAGHVANLHNEHESPHTPHGTEPAFSPTTANNPISDSSEPPTLSMPAARPTSQPVSESAPKPAKEPAPVLDEEGRTVPAPLVDAYAGSRSVAKEYTPLFRKIERDLTAHSQTKAGRAMVVSTIRAGTKNLQLAVEGAAYHCVCPHVRCDGTHEAGDHIDKKVGRCRVCGNVGLLTEDQFKATPPTVKRLIAKRADDDGVASPSGTDQPTHSLVSNPIVNRETPRSIEAVPTPQPEKPSPMGPSELPDSEIYWID